MKKQEHELKELADFKELANFIEKMTGTNCLKINKDLLAGRLGKDTKAVFIMAYLEDRISLQTLFAFDNAKEGEPSNLEKLIKDKFFIPIAYRGIQQFLRMDKDTVKAKIKKLKKLGFIEVRHEHEDGLQVRLIDKEDY